MIGKRLNSRPVYLFLDIDTALLPDLFNEDNLDIEFIPVQGLYIAVPKRMRELISQLSMLGKIVWTANWDLDDIREFALSYQSDPLIMEKSQDLKFWQPREKWMGITIGSMVWKKPTSVQGIAVSEHKGLVSSQVDVVSALTKAKI